MREPFIPLNSRIPRQLWLDLLSKVFSRDNPEGKFANLSEALRHYTKLGIDAEALLKEIKDPEFLKEMEGLFDQTKHYEILESMTDDERRALALALDVVQKRKWEQRKVV